MFFALLIILLALLFSLFRALTPWATQYKGEVEQHLSKLLGRSVTIQSMETGWYWFVPVIKLQKVKIQDIQEDNTLMLNTALVGIDVLRSLLHWRIQPGVLIISSVQLSLHQKDGRWDLDGFALPDTAPVNISKTFSNQLLTWLSQKDKLIFRHISINLHSETGQVLPLREVNFKLTRVGAHYSLQGKALLATKDATVFTLMGDFDIARMQLENISGEFYVSADSLFLSSWQIFVPELANYVQEGQGNLEWWINVNKGQVVSMQGQINSEQLRIKNQVIDELKANWAFRREPQGWVLTADELFMQLKGVAWPSNQALLQYDTEKAQYRLYVKTILLDSLALPLQPLEISQVQGTLTDSVVLFRDAQIDSVMSRFDKLGWQSKGPIVLTDNLSGVLFFDSTGGQLELDAEHASVQVKGLPLEHFSIMNAAFNWKFVEQDTARVTIDRLELSEPELAVSTQGAFDLIHKKTLGYVRLQVDFSANDLQKRLNSIPSDWFKPKFNTWLKKGIARIEKISGKLQINGLADAFPFDDGSGEFVLNSYLTGVDLFITPDWPLITDIEGALSVKGRNFTADIHHADFQGAPLEKAQLRIDGIGKGQDTLYIESNFTADAQKMMTFVLHSPVAKSLGLLKTLTLQGLASLNLNIEVPLYPEKDDVSVKGMLTFDNNVLLVKHLLTKLQLDAFSGVLDFNEQGVLESNLRAQLLGHPVDFTVSSSVTPKSETLIKMQGQFAIDSLKNYLKIPSLSWVKGTFSLETLVFVSSKSNALEHITFKSNLQGLDIRMPYPLGKGGGVALPVTVDMDFKKDNAFAVKLDYGHRLTSNLFFGERKGQLAFNAGVVRIGKTHAALENMDGLQIVGSLPFLDVHQWRNAWAQLSKKDTKSGVVASISRIHLFIGKMIAFDKTISDLILKLTPGNNKDWMIKITQKDIKASLNYASKTNNLSGYFSTLHLPSLNTASAVTKKMNIEPSDIPNMNIKINGLEWGSTKIGDITFTSKTMDTKLELSYCKIQAPGYTMNLEGTWEKNDDKEAVRFGLRAEFKDVAKSLEQWGITPVIGANRGDLQFDGGWSGSLFDFSLQKLSGKLDLTLKNGRITDLSPETEQKIGLGKLLSILSLQTLPRRLTLDFSDLSQKGFSFDIFKGTFAVKKGVLNTQNSYLDGPVAYAAMKGDLDFVNRLYDVNLSISPHITASLPLVATIAGGPIAGVAAWVAGKIINQGMQQISAYSYKVTGPWKEPVVQQLQIVKKR